MNNIIIGFFIIMIGCIIYLIIFAPIFRFMILGAIGLLIISWILGWALNHIIKRWYNKN